MDIQKDDKTLTIDPLSVHQSWQRGCGSSTEIRFRHQSYISNVKPFFCTLLNNIYAERINRNCRGDMISC